MSLLAMCAAQDAVSASGHVIANAGAAGLDHQSAEGFALRECEERKRLEHELRTDTYRSRAIRRIWIPRPGGHGQRPLGIPTVRVRVVQTALLHVLKSIFTATELNRSLLPRSMFHLEPLGE